MSAPQAGPAAASSCASCGSMPRTPACSCPATGGKPGAAPLHGMALASQPLRGTAYAILHTPGGEHTDDAGCERWPAQHCRVLPFESPAGCFARWMASRSWYQMRRRRLTGTAVSTGHPAGGQAGRWRLRQTSSSCWASLTGNRTSGMPLDREDAATDSAHALESLRLCQLCVAFDF